MSNLIDDKNFGKTFNDLKMDTSLDYIYKRSCVIDIDSFKNLKHGIDSINNYTNKGLYYLNPLIFAISNKNVNNVLSLLKNGSAPRGYDKFPGYPLYKTIDILHQDISYPINYNNSNDDIIKIMEILVSYGAKFDDYVVHVFWSKFNTVIENIDDKNKERIIPLYSKSQFSYNKYKIYLDILCEDSFNENDKERMLTSFENSYPQEKKSVFGLKLFF